MYNLIVILNQDTTDRQITVTTYKDEQTAINQSLDLLSLYLSEHQYCFGPDATGNVISYLNATLDCIEHRKEQKDFEYENPDEYIEDIRYYKGPGGIHSLTFNYHNGDSYIKFKILPCSEVPYTIDGL